MDRGAGVIGDHMLTCISTGTKLRTHLRYLIRRLLRPWNGPERAEEEVDHSTSLTSSDFLCLGVDALYAGAKWWVAVDSRDVIRGERADEMGGCEEDGRENLYKVFLLLLSLENLKGCDLDLLCLDTGLT